MIELPPPPVTNTPPVEVLWDIYCRTGSVKAAGQEVGLSHSCVHRRLLRAGYRLKSSKWTTEEDRRLAEYYEKTPPNLFSVETIAKELRRPYYGVAMRASIKGMGRYGRPFSDETRLIHATASKGKWTGRPHPRGFLAHTHDEASRQIISVKAKRMWSTHKTFGLKLCSEEYRQQISDRNTARQAARGYVNPYSRCSHGYRPDIGEFYFRSAWEANYARYLNFLIKHGQIERWEFEPTTFWFEEIRRGVRSYKPDFRVFERGKDPYYIEVKGWMDKRSKTKLARMKKYYPNIRVEIVGEKQYAAIAKKVGALIANWETAKNKVVFTRGVKP